MDKTPSAECALCGMPLSFAVLCWSHIEQITIRCDRCDMGQAYTMMIGEPHQSVQWAIESFTNGVQALPQARYLQLTQQIEALARSLPLLQKRVVRSPYDKSAMARYLDPALYRCAVCHATAKQPEEIEHYPIGPQGRTCPMAGVTEAIRVLSEWRAAERAQLDRQGVKLP